MHAIADEDMERENDEKTSAVHFLRFELEPAMMRALKGGAALSAGIDHPTIAWCVRCRSRRGDRTLAEIWRI